MARITGWRIHRGGEWIDSPGLDLGEVVRFNGADVVVYAADVLEAFTDDPGCPKIIATATPADGERVRCQVRTAHRVTDGKETEPPISMPFVEVLRGDGSIARAYLHPQHGLILSTQDLYL